MDDYKFQVEFLEEAKGFLDRLDEKARNKIVYNIWKARSTNDKELFKKLQDEIWEFRTKFRKVKSNGLKNQEKNILTKKTRRNENI